MFGFNSFAAAPFSATGEGGTDAVITLSGVSLTLTLSNTFSIEGRHHVNGTEIDLTLNSVIPQLAPTIASNAITSAVGSVEVNIDVDNITVTGTTLTSAVGTVVPAQFQTINATGQSINLATSGVAVDALTSVNATGNLMNLVVNSVALQQNNVVNVSGVTLSLSLGNAIPEVAVNVAGNAMNLTVNSVTLASNVDIIPTGVLLELVGNPLSVFTWNVVDDTTTGGNTWSDVSIVGSGGSSWTEVSTTGAGSINPAQEVA